MLDPHLLRNQFNEIAEALGKRNISLDQAAFEKLESERKEVQVKTQELQNKKNTSAKEIGKVKSQGGDIEPLLKKVASLGDELKSHEQKLSEIQAQLHELLMGIPNAPHESVPAGKH